MSNYHTHLEDFIAVDDGLYSYQFVKEESIRDVLIKKLTYSLISQKWPIEVETTIPTSIWTHRLEICMSVVVKCSKVMLYIAGGETLYEHGKAVQIEP